MTVREPAVAGLFYPGEAERLSADIDAFLRNSATHSGPAPKALIVPHAGYVYSGLVAAAGYRLLEPARHRIRRVALFGPAHRAYLEGMAIPSTDAFATPLGTTRVDRDATDTVAAMSGVCVSDAAHRDEHCLEVQLPFLQTVLEDFELLPVVVGRCDPTLVAAVIDAVWGGDETLIVVSSDLSHYLAYEEACAIDARTRDRILAKATSLQGNEACGANAVNGLMSARKARELEVEAIDLRNSGDTAGDKSQVVGYGTFTLH